VPLRHHHVVLGVVADQWRNPNAACPVFHRLEFSSEKEHIYGMEVSMIALSQEGLMADTDISVVDAEGNRVEFEKFPMRDSDNPNRRSLGLFFLPPLPPNKRFVLSISEEARLQAADFKDLLYRTQRLGDYVIEQIDLILHVPKGMKVAFAKHDESPEGKSMNGADQEKLKRDKGLEVIGWTGTQIKLSRNQPFGVFIIKK
jgi:hypothetical protein